MKLLINLVINIGLKNEKEFLRELARLEYALSIFCYKLVVKARTENLIFESRKGIYFNLANELLEHGNQELKHGKMLASLADGKAKITPDSKTGRFIEMKLEAGNHDLILPKKPKRGFKILSWHSVKFPGQIINAKHENFDGISPRYLSLKVLFGGKSADSFNWIDKLAFMCTLEKGTTLFYELLSIHPKASPELKAIASQISQDEKMHREYLRYSLRFFTKFPNEAINKWESKINIAKFGLLIDLLRII